MKVKVISNHDNGHSELVAIITHDKANDVYQANLPQLEATEESALGETGALLQEYDLCSLGSEILTYTLCKRNNALNRGSDIEFKAELEIGAYLQHSYALPDDGWIKGLKASGFTVIEER